MQLARASALCAAALLCGCPGAIVVDAVVDDAGSGPGPAPVGPPTALRIDGLPAQGATIAVGDSVPLRAMALYSDGIERDASDKAVFSASPRAILSIDAATHVLRGLARGDGAVEVSLPPLRATASVRVRNAGEETTVRIEVAPSTATIAPGVGVQLRATATQADGSQRAATDLVSWATSDAAICTVVGGFVTGMAGGSCTVTAQLGALTASSAITVQDLTVAALAVSPASATVARGETVQLLATATMSDGSARDVTRTAAWTVDAPSTASVVEGRVSGLAVGTAGVTATLSGTSAKATVTVSDARVLGVSIVPPAFSLPLGLSQQCRAVAVFADGTSSEVTGQADWKSESNAIATVEGGLVRSVAPGRVRITATFRSVSGIALATVTGAQLVQLGLLPPSLTLPIGTSGRLRAFGVFTDRSIREVSGEAVWSVGDPGIATVDPTGLVSGLAKGNTEVKAALSGLSATAAVSVTDAELTRILVGPVTMALPVGMSGRFNATGIYSDNTLRDVTGDATWSSSDAAVATISNALGSRGLATATGQGTAQIAAKIGSIASLPATLTVTAATLLGVRLVPERLVIPQGLTLLVRLLARYSDGSEFDLTDNSTFVSDNPQVATVVGSGPGAGFITGIAQGRANITGTLGGQSAIAQVQVVQAQLQALRIMGPTQLKVGETVQLRAFGRFQGGPAEFDVTLLCQWSSLQPQVARFIPNLPGVLQAVGPGQASVTAALQGIFATHNVSVSQATPTSIAVIDDEVTIPVQLTRQLIAVATYSDGTKADVTLAADWASSDNGIAIAGNAGIGKGLVTAVSPGATTVTASVGNVAGKGKVTVVDAKAKSVIVTPTNPTVPPNTRGFQFYATGLFDDGQYYDLTRTASWSSDTPEVCVVFDSPPALKGRADIFAPGGATITARFGTLKGSTFLTSR